MWNLAIDFGTSNTTGATWADGVVEPVEVDGRRQVPSVVLLSADGTWVVGRQADNQSAVVPERVERAPKRRLGKGRTLLLGGQAVPITSAVAALLGPHTAAARARHAGDPGHIVLTHPARWGPERLDVLRTAAHEAGFPRVELVPEPVAAAHYVDDPLEVGQHVAVYDLGGGTFDTCVVRRTETSYKVVGLPGGNERIGGEDFDHRMYQHLGAAVGREDPAAWDNMQTSDERQWQRAAADLLTNARDAKEQLSRNPRASVYVGPIERDITVTRDEFEALVADDVDRTVDEMSRTIANAGLTEAEIAKVYLVGGSSRLPLVQQRMGARFGDRVSTWDDPKGVVVLGAAKFSGTLAGGGTGGAAPAATPAPEPPVPSGPIVVSAPPARGDQGAPGSVPPASAPVPPAASAAPAAHGTPPPAAYPTPGAPPDPSYGTPAPYGTPAAAPSPYAAPSHPQAAAPAPGYPQASAPTPGYAAPAPGAGYPGGPTPAGWAPAGPQGKPAGSNEVLYAWIAAATVLICCPIGPAVGAYFANEAKKKGHPQGQTALIVNLVALGLVLVGWLFWILASLGSSSSTT
jgi:actin-like ATPase involved in cell morphogenesis